MNSRKFAIAYLSTFENENTIYIVNGVDEVDAFKIFAIHLLQGGKFEEDEDWIKWINESGNTINEIKDTMASSDIYIDIKEII